MPSSCDSDKSSSPSLITSLRSFRFQNKRKPYRPSQSTPSQSSQNSQKSEVTLNDISSNNTILLNAANHGNITTTSTTGNNKVNAILSVPATTLIQHLTSKIRSVIASDSSNNLLKLKLNPEEIKRLKKEVAVDPQESYKWSQNVTEELIDKTLPVSSGLEKVLKINRQYLNDLLRHFETTANIQNLNTLYDATCIAKNVQQNTSNNIQNSSKTYAKNNLDTNLTPNENVITSETLPKIQSNVKPPLGNNFTMEDYDVFCEKEQHLKQLLDAFPGADIMEAQDILVHCNWDLKKAIEIAKNKPLRTSRKRISTSSYPELVNQEIMEGSTSQFNLGASQSTLNQVAEEIVLDSSDEDTPNTSLTRTSLNNFSYQAKNSRIQQPLAKKARRIIDSDSEEEKLYYTSSSSNDNKHLTLLTKNIEKDTSQKSNNIDIEKISLWPKSRQKNKLLSNNETNANSNSNSKASSLNLNNLPNLPAGLVITQIASGESEVSNQSTISQGNNRTFADQFELNLQSQNSKSKVNRSKRKKFDSDEDFDDDFHNEDIYDSEDSDCGETLTPAHSAVLKFFQEATLEELSCIPGCSKKKAEAIIALRTFERWADLVEKLKNDKYLSTDLLNGAKKVLDMRNSINKLMAKCQKIANDMGDLVENLKENKESCSDYVSKQPDLLNDRMHLTPYQMLGLNWLLLMHNQEVNGILADEMGLGKTVQAIAFLAYLKEISISGPHLIVVPSSTLDNWKKELEIWWPSVSVICYHGSQDFRRELRTQILNDEVDEFDVMVTTYNMVTSSAEDRNFFKRLEFHYVVFDEAHMLKNMSSQRYQHLMRIRAPRRLLLTGTPLQNNLVELMSLLIFAMPHIFSNKIEQIKQMFSCVGKTDENKSSFEKDKVEHAKLIMKPFVLRRLKRDVLKELPAKTEEIISCIMPEDQAKKYTDLVKTFSQEVQSNKEKATSSSGSGMMMQLRKAANHPLLLREHYTTEKLVKMSKLMIKEPTHKASDPNLVFEDMLVMSDFELHKLCKTYKHINPYILSDEYILNSGKFKILDSLLPQMLKEDHRILLFSQFTMVLDILEEYMRIKDFKYLRLDGQVPVSERQQLIDDFNGDPDISVFLLSTKAGGLGINLTAADTVIIHDIDFNPYNDRQAEDRCHRVGQVRDVRVIRLISENTIEEVMLQRAKEKLKLERDIHEENDTEENDAVSVAKLLREALGLKKM